MNPNNAAFDKLEAKEETKKVYTDILKECATIGEQRMSQYDDPMKSMQIACDILQTSFGITLNVEQMALVLVALKFSRSFKSYNEDNILDAINYLAISLDAHRKENYAYPN